MNANERVGSPAAHPLEEKLDAMEDAQLIRRLAETDPAYLFKHGLVQDTAYTSLMRHDRRRLHRLVGETLERLSGEHVAELAAVLGQHFSEAGDTARARHYLQLAGDDAAARYANQEALAFYTQALDAAQAAERGELYRVRGLVYERIGEPDKARADLEHALELAQAEQDLLGEWQSLMDLGYAWSARDYGRSGEYLERALDLARERGEPLLLARSLNRVGNWYLNNEDPEQALIYHREALSIFQAQQDTRGVAETTDLLGMTYTLGGNLIEATKNYDHALQFAGELGDKAALAAALTTMALRAPSPQTYTMVPAEQDVARALANARRALPLTQEIGWRAGEAYILWVMGFTLSAYGDYTSGFAQARTALAIAQEIGHDQWTVAALIAIGDLYRQILALDLARETLEDAYARARTTRSQHWTRTCAGFLISTCVAQGDLNRAEELVTAVLSPDTPAQTVGQRLCYVGKIQLALARRDAANALVLIEKMVAQTPNYSANTIIPQLSLLRGEAYLEQGVLGQAEADLQAGLAQAQLEKNPWLQWQLHLQLLRLYHALGRPAEVRAHAEAIRAIIASLLPHIDDAALRENFAATLSERIASDEGVL